MFIGSFHFYLTQRTTMPLNPRFLILTLMVLVTTLFRLVDHGLINFAPVGAIALFGGAHFKSRRTAFGVTFASMVLSDVLLYVTRYQAWAAESLKSMMFVYLAFAVVVLIGRLLQDRRTVGRVACASVVSSLVFFLISNLAAWALYPEYSKDVSGLMQCYWAGIPFIQGQSPLVNTLLADLLFNSALFGTFALLQQRVTVLRAEAAA